MSRPATAGAATARPADVTIEGPRLRFRTNVNIELTATGSEATVSGSCRATGGITIEPGGAITIPSNRIQINSSASPITIEASGSLSISAGPVLISSNTVGGLECNVTGTTPGGISVSASQTIDVPGSVLAANTAGCVPNSTTLCAFNNRFQIQANAVHSSGQTSTGVVPSSSSRFNDGGYLWFFNDRNTELMVQLLNRCSAQGRYWVFNSGQTSMQITIDVTDTQTGVSRRYTNPQGQPFRPVTDTDAFATCP
jgi:hypothetical protein